MPRLSAALGVDLHVKREDMTGLAFGGNKTRELDFFIGEALRSGATVFIAGGGVAQSNHAVQCAAAALRADSMSGDCISPPAARPRSGCCLA